VSAPRPLTIVPVYPTLLSIYADRGNVRVLEQRARWRGIDVEVSPLELGADLDPATADVILLGGGQDRDQVLVADELRRQTPRLQAALADGACLLAVCGGYQLLGHLYRGHQGDEIRGTGLVDLETLAGDSRLIGNVLCECTVDGERRHMVGFENHAGRTHLGPGVAPLGRVVAGAGNNGVDGTEGCQAGRILGTYVHGPLLPKNPWIADRLLAQGLERLGLDPALAPLDDGAEEAAATRAAAIARAERR
jgi:CobQ-like glutamine amidotransferase family enzyme